MTKSNPTVISEVHGAAADDVVEEEALDVGAEAAGAARGVSRSLVAGNAALRSPIGALPQKAVAKFTDRLATSMTVLDSVSESSDRKSILKRARVFGISFVKNTVLGIALFEIYGYAIGKLAPPEQDATIDTDAATIRNNSNVQMIHRDNKVNNETTIIKEDNGSKADKYDLASVGAHVLAGSAAGSFHGIATFLTEQLPSAYNNSSSSSKSRNMVRMAAWNLQHHAVSHAVLFGSYEFLKRGLVGKLHELNSSTPYFGSGYLVSFGIAGGLAGQGQHVVSHIAEQIIMAANSATAAAGRQVPLSPKGSTASSGDALFRRYRLLCKSIAAPSLRSTLMAFPPSAIGFVAFEYGKKFMNY